MWPIVRCPLPHAHNVSFIHPRRRHVCTTEETSMVCLWWLAVYLSLLSLMQWYGVGSTRWAGIQCAQKLDGASCSIEYACTLRSPSFRHLTVTWTTRLRERKENPKIRSLASFEMAYIFLVVMAYTTSCQHWANLLSYDGSGREGAVFELQTFHSPASCPVWTPNTELFVRFLLRDFGRTFAGYLRR